MRMQNFKYLDPAYTTTTNKGLGHVAKLDKAIFEEFRHDWGMLSYQAEQFTGLNLFDADPLQGAKPLSSLTNIKVVSRERQFFRRAVMAANENTCCLSGVTVPIMLVASHIKPYSKCRTSNERASPTNGLCLNTFYDKAFDQGIITVDPYYKVRVSTKVREQYPQEACENWLYHLEGKTISLPERFRPDPKFLEYHTDKVFQW
jgi:putative restriction endonuclease